MITQSTSAKNTDWGHIRRLARWALLVVVALGLGGVGALAQQARPADPVPAGAITQFGSPRLQDFSIDRCASFSPDGKLLATAGANSPICIWDVVTGKRVDSFRTNGSVYDLRFTPACTLAVLAMFGHDDFWMRELT